MNLSLRSWLTAGTLPCLFSAHARPDFLTGGRILLFSRIAIERFRGCLCGRALVNWRRFQMQSTEPRYPLAATLMSPCAVGNKPLSLGAFLFLVQNSAGLRPSHLVSESQSTSPLTGPGRPHSATVPSLQSTQRDCCATRDSGRCCPACS